jgi:hypothetical protein
MPDHAIPAARRWFLTAQTHVRSSVTSSNIPMDEVALDQVLQLFGFPLLIITLALVHTYHCLHEMRDTTLRSTSPYHLS